MINHAVGKRSRQRGDPTVTLTAQQPDDAAIATIIERKAEVGVLLSGLSDTSENHCDARPNAIHWCHAGKLGRAAVMLRESAAVLNA